MSQPAHTYLACVSLFTSLAALACGQLVVDDHGRSETERWLGNPDACPADPPADGDDCSSEGLYCAYRMRDATAEMLDEFQDFACRIWPGGMTRFSLYEDGGAEGCPDVEPVQGSDCSGQRGIECKYPPRVDCFCPEDAATLATWNCVPQHRAHVSTGPTGIDPTLAVTQLSADQRDAWCRWFLLASHGPGYISSNSPVDSNGYTLSNICIGGWAPVCSAVIPDLSPTDCAQNLALSSCDAEVGALTDCVLTIADACWPAPHGCAPYLDTPGCDGTVVVGGAIRIDGAPGEDAIGLAFSCPVRVR